jgi:PBSX family phage terminase large subunit
MSEKQFSIDDIPADKIEILYELMQKKLRKKQTRNEIYSIIEDFPGRYIVLIGGSGSGKSYEIADRIIDRMEEEPKSRILGVRAQRNQVSESQFPLLKSRSKQEGRKGFDKKESKGNEEVFNTNGSQTIFSGLDDVEKLKSIFDITSVWVEEADQTTEDDLNELDRRLRGYTGLMQIYMSFNPVSVLSWIKRRFFDGRVKDYTILENGQKVIKRFNRTITIRGERAFEDFTYYKDLHLTKQELQEKIMVWSDEKQDFAEEYLYNTLIIHSTYLDNRFIDAQYYKVMQEMKESNPDEYNIYGLGQWGISGGTFFDKGNINKRIAAAPLPLKVGYFDYIYENEKIKDDTITWVDDKTGFIKLYELPQKGYPYVGGGDTSGEGSDWNIGAFTNNVTGEDVAVLRYQYDEDLYARQMYCLGKYYNNALLGIETNFSTHPVKELERLGYSHQYVREESPDSFTGKLRPVYGFQTNKATRPTALGMLRTVVRESPERIKDMDTLLEMTTFVKNEQGRPEAAKGSHDDCVMARAINCYIAHQQTREIQFYSEVDLSGLPEDALEDFNRASAEGKKHLLKQWGKDKEVVGKHGEVIIAKVNGKRVYI